MSAGSHLSIEEENDPGLVPVNLPFKEC